MPTGGAVGSTSSTAGNQLRAVTPKGAGINCGWVTCSVYIYRGTTASMGNFLKRYTNASAAAIAGAFAVACAPIGGVSAVVCAAVGAVFGGLAIDQFVTATNQHACIRIRYLGIFPNTLTGIYVDNGGYCRN